MYGRMERVETEETPDVLNERLRTPMHIVAQGFSGGGVPRRKRVVDEGGAHWRTGFDGLRDQAAAERHCGLIADTGGAFGKEDYRQAIAEAFGHAFRRFGRAAALAASDVDGAAHEAHPAEQRCFAELDLGDEDARTHRGVEQDVDVGEVIGDDGAGHGDVANDVEGDIHAAEDAATEGAEPGGAVRTSLRTRDCEFHRGVREVSDDLYGTVELTNQVQTDVPFER